MNFIFSGVLNYDEVLNASPESDVSEIEKLQTEISPSSCANIQFTSGTTGHPKAARISHFSLVNNGYDMGLYICKLTSICFSIFNFMLD